MAPTTLRARSNRDLGHAVEEWAAWPLVVASLEPRIGQYETFSIASDSRAMQEERTVQLGLTQTQHPMVGRQHDQTA